MSGWIENIKKEKKKIETLRKEDKEGKKGYQYNTFPFIMIFKFMMTYIYRGKCCNKAR